MDKIREEFEAWFCSTIPYPIAKEIWFAVMDDGDYIITDVQAAWAGWKASRSSLCVELPEKMSDEVLSLYDIGFNDGIDGAMECIEDAGVSYK